MTRQKKLARPAHPVPWLCGAAVVLVLGALLLRWGYRRYLRSVYPTEHSQIVAACAEEYDVPASLIYAVIHTESGFRETALSSADAKGLMQLTDDTFLWALSRAGDKDKYTVDDLYDPQVNIRYGTLVLHLLSQQFADPETVLAAYNAGQGRVRSWLNDSRYSSDGVHLDRIPYTETANYVRRVTAAQQRYRTLYGLP